MLRDQPRRTITHRQKAHERHPCRGYSATDYPHPHQPLSRTYAFTNAFSIRWQRNEMISVVHHLGKKTAGHVAIVKAA
ncbi:hypothetical protein [Lacticaseibacillus camelliae]|uniref:hypothetical protein n=1 Tax=Lacticaseibacillus camelliae TaxID=381742 RepID=UPI0012E1C2B7|nr:hypothetical protein [Lacticaseibacillus camelliae]